MVRLIALIAAFLAATDALAFSTVQAPLRIPTKLARTAHPVCQFGSFGTTKAPTKKAAKKPAQKFQIGNFPGTASKPAKKATKKGKIFVAKKKDPIPSQIIVPGAVGVAALGAVPATALALVVALVLFGGGKAPDQLPFNFLDGFYPPAIEKKAELNKIAAAKAARIKAEKEAAEKKKAEEEKAAKEKADKEEKEAKAKEAAAAAAPAKAAAAPPAPAKAAATPPAPAKAAAPAAQAPLKAVPAPTPPPPVKAATVPAPAKAAAPAPPALVKTVKGETRGPIRQYDIERNRGVEKGGKLGPEAKPLPMVNAELAGKPGFNDRGEPSSPGALKAYEAEKARAKAAVERKAAREKAVKEAQEARAAKSKLKAVRDAA